MNAVVDTLVRGEGGSVDVTFRIYEGEPVRLAKLAIVGLDSIPDLAALKRALPLREGEPFNRMLFPASPGTSAHPSRNHRLPNAALLPRNDADAAAGKAATKCQT